MSKFFLLFVIIILNFLNACSAPSNSGAVYDRGALNTAQRTIEAKIVSKRPVTIKGGTGLGSSTGSLIGGITGGNLGGGSSEKAVGAITGAIVGGTIGAVVENKSLKTKALEYVVDSNVAGLMTIIMTDDSFNVGDNVFLVLGRTPKLIKKIN